MDLGNEVLFLDYNSLELPEQEQFLRNQIFDHLENERKRMVEVLQEDVAQLVAIAKIKLSANNAENVEECLAMALARLSDLSFEIKPQILEEFGLAATLRQLLRKRLAKFCEIHVNELPANLNFTTETALFRLIQQILNTLPASLVYKFKIDITMTNSQICLTNKFGLQSHTEPCLQPKFIAGAIVSSLKHIIYMFSGSIAFQLFTGEQVELLIYLKELI